MKLDTVPPLKNPALSDLLFSLDLRLLEWLLLLSKRNFSTEEAARLI